MLKKYRLTLIVTTLVILIPVLVGLILWNRLPEQVPTHFNFAGEADGWSGRAFAVFGLPGMMLGMHWFCALCTLVADPKANQMESKMIGLILWIIPVVTLGVTGLVYGAALGVDAPVDLILPLLLGLLMAAIGNWMPKCKPSYTLGIRLPWTLADEDNWNATHRFAAPFWVTGGLVMMVSAFLAETGVWLICAALVVMAAAPAAYSYSLWRRKTKG